jgi:thiamine pyrophosphate-dependent acetolactate synthase large subunit-like protein
VKRFECLKALFDNMAADVIVVGNVGDTATAMQTFRSSDANVYSVNLGSCSAMGLGLALGLPHRRVVVLDGDGNLLLNLAVLADIAREAPANLAIIVQDNEVYGAAGNMPSATAGPADLAGLAKSAGIQRAGTIRDLGAFKNAVDDILKAPGPLLFVAKIETESDRPQSSTTYNPVENKFKFVRYIEATEGVRIIPQTHGSKVIL